jgi:hypothetical protein
MGSKDVNYNLCQFYSSLTSYINFKEAFSGLFFLFSLLAGEDFG